MSFSFSRQLLWVVAVCFFTAPLVAQPASAPRLQEVEFVSRSLQRETRYRVLLPALYEESERRYPVLYLLHGLYGDHTNWSTLTRLQEHARGLDVIIVMPDAGNSWYVDSPTDPKARYETFIVTDLVPEIERRYRVLSHRRHRGVAGLSMGGYGALKFALKYPHLFIFAGSLSGALQPTRDLEVAAPQFRPFLEASFGPPGSPTRVGNDIYRLVQQLSSSDQDFYLACGAGDAFLDRNREFARLLQSRGARYEYHEVPGQHDWEFWDAQLPHLLASAARSLMANR